MPLLKLNQYKNDKSYEKEPSWIILIFKLKQKILCGASGFSRKYNQKFRRERLLLSPRGIFDFDAVSSDNSIMANISTSSDLTSGGKSTAGNNM